MGIRAICFLPSRNMNDDNILDISQYLSTFREGLFKLGAFGFDKWVCSFERIVGNTQNAADSSEINIIYFNDANEVIVGFNDNQILIGDSSFPSIFPELGMNKKMPIFRVDGDMAQLGDFKIRYGTMYNPSKEKQEKQYGILFDIEYLPVHKLNTDYKPLFDSVLALLTEKTDHHPPQLFLAPKAQEEFTFQHLGYLYFQIRQFAN